MGMIKESSENAVDVARVVPSARSSMHHDCDVGKRQALRVLHFTLRNRAYIWRTSRFPLYRALLESRSERDAQPEIKQLLSTSRWSSPSENWQGVTL